MGRLDAYNATQAEVSAAALNGMGVAATAINFAGNLLATKTPLQISAGLIEVQNIEAQARVLDEASASGDNAKIIEASLNTAAAMASVLALLLPPPARLGAVGISLGLSLAAQLVHNNPSAVNKAIKDVFEYPIGDANRNGIPDIHEGNWIDPKTKTWWDNAINFIVRRDPLTFDLDGDGLETIGASTTNPILFDHDGDGIKNGTGWVKPDDAFLVLDKNGNGTIDNGLELFGDSTVKSNGQKATDGFDAIADLDTNHDGIVNANDAQFNNLKLWRDLNQDGISQSNELFTLSSQHIVGINVANIEHSQVLPNGNELADKGTFIKDDGSQGEVGVVTGDLGDINLADDTFNRIFPDKLDTSNVANLPDMQGSGKVRDLLEATTQSTRLQTLLTQYSQAQTRAEQMGLIDSMLDAWADTSGMAESLDDRVAGVKYESRVFNGQEYVRNPLGDLPYNVIYEAFGNVRRTYVSDTTLSSAGSTGGGQLGSLPVRDLDNDTLTEEYKQLIASWQQKMHIIEAFNGSYFFGLPQTEQPQGARSGLDIVASTNKALKQSAGVVITNIPLGINYSQQQLDLLQKSYESIRTSVYNALLLQTRFKPLLDQIGLVIDQDGIRLDFSELTNTFKQKLSSNPVQGVIDLIEFNVATRDLLIDTDWGRWDLLEADIDLAHTSEEIRATLKFYGILSVGNDGFLEAGTTIDDFILGDSSDNLIRGNGGKDLIYGYGGNDTILGSGLSDSLFGGSGNDIIGASATIESTRGNERGTSNYLEGGTGNDLLYGSGGSDTYYFNRGDGVDVIDEPFGSTVHADSGVDKLQFGPEISSSDLILRRPMNSQDLVVRFVDSEDQITIKNWYLHSRYRLESFNFADGTVWSKEKITQDGLISEGTSGNDNISSIGEYGNTLYGYGGNDTILGSGLSDSLFGGSGNDIIGASATIESTRGNERGTSNYLEGGTGNDLLYGSGGSDTYYFNRGDGVDVIDEPFGSTVHADSGVDKLQFGPEISSSDLILRRPMNSQDLVVRFVDSEDQITIKNWYLHSRYRLESFNFADGTVWSKEKITQDGLISEGTSGNDNISSIGEYGNTLYGYGGNDTILGSGLSDSLFGGSGNDIIGASATIESTRGNERGTSNYLEGGTGNDLLYGSGGSDTYYFNRGDGVDVIDEPFGSTVHADSGVDKLQFGPEISSSDLILRRPMNSQDLVVRFVDSEDQITIKNWYLHSRYRLESFNFADGTVWNGSIVGQLTINQAPLVNSSLEKLELSTLNTFEYQIPANLFIDPDVGDVLSYNMTLSNGSPLPMWLNFDPHTRTLSGMPSSNEVGDIELKLTVMDIAGASASQKFDISVRKVNSSPTVSALLDNLAETEDVGFSYTIPADTFSDVDVADILTYSVTLANGEPLPSWLNFDVNTRTLTGTPANSEVGSIPLKVTATDTAGASASQIFNVNVANVNDAPIVSVAIGAQTATEDVAFSYIIPADAFADVDLGDTLSYSVTLADGESLPNWLSFDAAKRTISGTPTNSEVGNIGLKVTATDNNGASANQTFSLSVANVNDSPIVWVRIGEQVAIEDLAFSYTIPADTFTDVDVGDSLNYNVTLADGSPLPSWLNFDVNSLTLSGMPSNNEVGDIVLNVIATDMAGATASQPFTLNIANVNDAPAVSVSIGTQVATEDSNFTYIIPAEAFADVDVGDVLTYVVTSINGDSLPSWLSFDAATKTISGTPSNSEVGNITLKVIATDSSGESAEQLLTVNVANVNDAPTVLVAIEAQNATEDVAFSYTIPVDAFADVDVVDSLTFTTTLSDGNSLPSWLSFDADTRTFSGNLGNSEVGNITLKVIATDLSGESAEQSFTVNVANVNDAPIVSVVIDAQATTEDVAFSYIIPADAFADVDSGDTLSYSVTLANGDSLPSWLSFDVMTRSISGTPTNSEVGNIALKVTATDTAGASANQTFTVNVANVNDAPTVSVAIGTQAATEDVAFSYSIPANAFADVDVGDTLSYSVSLANGNPLPSWLNYNATTKTISGTPSNSEVGNIALKVTATDTAGASANQTFTVNVANVNDAPIVAGSIPNQTAVYGTPFNLALSKSLIQDVDVGDTLTYTVTKSDGSALPTWISFNSDTMVLSGNPVAADVGSTYQFRLKATDSSGASATVAFGLFVDGVVDQTLTGTEGNNVLTGGIGNDTLYGYSGNDILNGGAGNDVLDGGIGTDTMIGGLGNDSYYVESATDVVVESAGEGSDTVISNISYTLGANVENITLSGTGWINATGNSADNVLVGNDGWNTLNAGAGNDILYGGGGVNFLYGGTGNDTYIVNSTLDFVTEYYNEGIDTIMSSVTWTLGANQENLILTGNTAINVTGNGQSNLLVGNDANNTLNDFSGGNDIMQGLGGNDILTAYAGNDVLDGGAGADTLNGGTANDILIGGKGNDTITTDSGRDVIVFNKGDGQDEVNASIGADNTLSLGGGFTYSDLSLSKNANDLILKVGATDQVTLKDWYTVSWFGLFGNNKSVVNLQVVAEAMQGFSLGGSDALRNNKVENFNFANLVAAFDASGAPSNWQLTDARLTAHLQTGSNSAAIGCDVAYQYGMNGNLTGLGLTATQNVINSASFGQTAQTLNAPSTWANESVKLA